MEPGQGMITPENIVDSSDTPEASKAAELIPVSPQVDPTGDADDTQVPEPTVPQEPIAVTEEIPEAEVKDLVDSKVERADSDWTAKVKDVIRDDSGQPFKEEEDAEDLNESYMKSRFNVDVDAPIEEK